MLRENHDAFHACSYPPLGLADHNVICLLPLYKQELKRHKPQYHSAPQWAVGEGKPQILQAQGLGQPQGDKQEHQE